MTDFIQKNKKLLLLIAALAIIPVLAAILIGRVPQFQRSQKVGSPSAQIQIQQPKVESKHQSLQQGPFKCPATSSFCQTGKEILKDGKYVGFGAKIATGSAVIAAFDGQISSISSTLPQLNNEKIITVYLDNNERGLRAVYYYQGIQPPEAKSVKAGEVIDNMGDIMELYNASLVFTLFKNDFYAEEGEKLSSADFVQ